MCKWVWQVLELIFEQVLEYLKIRVLNWCWKVSLPSVAFETDHFVSATSSRGLCCTGREFFQVVSFECVGMECVCVCRHCAQIIHVPEIKCVQQQGVLLWGIKLILEVCHLPVDWGPSLAVIQFIWQVQVLFQMPLLGWSGNIQTLSCVVLVRDGGDKSHFAVVTSCFFCGFTSSPTNLSVFGRIIGLW